MCPRSPQPCRQRKQEQDATRGQKQRERTLADANKDNDWGTATAGDNDSFFKYAGAKPIPLYRTVGDLLEAEKAETVDWSIPFIITSVPEWVSIAESPEAKRATAAMKAQIAAATTE